MVKQNALFILTPIKSGKVEGLRKLLNRIGHHVVKSNVIPFEKLKTVHYMRWLILDKKNTENGSYSNQLVLSTNYDGDREDHLNELVTVAEEGFDQIYQYCDGYPNEANATKESRKDYLT